jgi:putative phosphoesterase
VIVGLISDTHGLLRPQVGRVFDGVDLILHAGDVGGRAVLEGLAKIAPVDAVFGNVDDRNDPALARERTLTHDGVTIHVSHGHELGRPTPELALSRYIGDVVVFGHTHRAVTIRTAEGRVAVNPGAAGPRRFDIVPTVARMVVSRQFDPLQSPPHVEVEIISLA